MIGLRAGKLLVLSYAFTKNKRAFWKCRCDCGKEKDVMGKYLRLNQVKSCGCLNRQGIDGPANYRHGHSGFKKVGIKRRVTATYTSWVGMRQRCYNPKNPKFKDYGARGITVCSEWETFAGFLKDMGEKIPRSTIGRIHNDVPYCKSNCRWETSWQQMGNTRRNVYLTWKGTRLHAAEWARRLQVNYFTLLSRIKKKGKKAALLWAMTGNRVAPFGTTIKM